MKKVVKKFTGEVFTYIKYDSICGLKEEQQATLKPLIKSYNKNTKVLKLYGGAVQNKDEVIVCKGSCKLLLSKYNTISKISKSDYELEYIDFNEHDAYIIKQCPNCNKYNFRYTEYGNLTQLICTNCKKSVVVNKKNGS